MKTIAVGSRREVFPSTVIFLEADTNYTRLYFEDGKQIIVSYTLKKLQARFENELNFFRCNRSCFINLDFISSFDRDTSQIMMNNDRSISVSRRRKLMFLNQFNQNFLN